VHDVAREVPQQVAPGDPGWQREALLGRRVVDAALDLEVMPVKIGEPNAVTNQGQVLRARLRARSKRAHCRTGALC